jgi:hypothetical protein
MNTIRRDFKRFPLAKPAYASFPAGCPAKVEGLNRIEPKWAHGKRAIVEPARLLTTSELRQRVCDYFGCEQVDLLSQKVA